MNKNAIKNYAVWARNELITRVTQKAFEYGVSKDNIVDFNADSINGKLLNTEEKQLRQKLISEVKEKGFDQVIEEVAYTWFNRFIALRYMEVNNYLPNRIRVFTNENNEFKPQLLDEAATVELDGLDNEKVYELVEANKNEELYKLLLLATCNDMHNYLPGIFETIYDYKVLLFPENLLRNESVLGRLISEIDEDSWLNQVEIIGWMYQYYISEKHDQVITINKGAIKKEDIPAATQLFTTDWVVRYMVDNSLGRYWMERNPNSTVGEKLQFLATSKSDNLTVISEPISPENLTFMDDCMGSGHILVYAFDVLMNIYRECGYSDRDAAESIIENNLFGLDIDSRAYQLAYFAIMMKGRSYNRRILSKHIKHNLTDIVETNMLSSYKFDGMPTNDKMDKIGEYLINRFKDAKELGSLIKVDKYDYDAFEKWISSIHDESNITLDFLNWSEHVYPLLLQLCKQAKILCNKYVSVTTNPPYLSKMEGNLKKYIANNYKDYSADLFAVFIRRNFDLTRKDGYLGFMTPFVWMFIKSYEKLRKYIIENKSIVSLIQLEYSAYDEATVPICTFILQNNRNHKVGQYIRLSDFKGNMEVQKIKTLDALSDHNCRYFYDTSISSFKNIPGNPIDYWANDTVLNSFKANRPLGDYAEIVSGMTTGNNEKYMRDWKEVDISTIAFNQKNIDDVDLKKTYWFPYNKGGAFRRWYGNNDYVVNWSKSHEFNRSKTTMKYLYLKPCITWSDITSAIFSARACGHGFFFDVKGSCAFPDDESYLPLIAFLNSKVTMMYIKLLNPTITTQVGDLKRIPFSPEAYNNTIKECAQKCIEIGKKDYDSFELSWDFKKSPLITGHDLISDAFEKWKEICTDRFDQMKTNEFIINKYFIDLYELQDEISPQMEDKYVSVYLANENNDIKDFISYAVGCMFGRYSLDNEGIVCGGTTFNVEKYSSFIPDDDNIIPISDDDYFNDDISNRFIQFVKTVYGSSTLEENLKYISKCLDGKGNPREVIRNYFLNEFYDDHVKKYQKRPIYWLFDSGKKNGFKALIYIHRYTSDLIARMRTQYIHEQQARYRNQIEMLEKQVDSDISTSERVRLNKQLKKFKEQDEELRKYEEKIHHWADRMEPMNLDDGVKANYAKFQELLAKIK